MLCYRSRMLAKLQQLQLREWEHVRTSGEGNTGKVSESGGMQRVVLNGTTFSLRPSKAGPVHVLAAVSRRYRRWRFPPKMALLWFAEG